MSEYGTATVDLNDLSLWDQEVEYNPEAELTTSVIPPDDKRHVVKWKLGSRGIGEPKKSANGKVFFSAHLQGNIVAPGEYYDNAAIFDQLTSIVFESGTSGMHAWLKGIGQPAPGRCSLGELKQRVMDALASEPMCRVRGRWEASVKTGTNSNGKAIYETKLKKMRNFPQLADGRYNSEVDIDGQTVRAQFAVQDYLPIE